MKTADFIKAYTLLYGPAYDAPAQLLKQLNDRDLKSTFRRKALMCHPDRATINSADAGELDRKFKEINWAYQTLKEALSMGQVTAQATQTPAQPRPAPRPAPQTVYRGPTAAYNDYQAQKSPNDHYWCGAVPRQKLPFGQYLYYNGRISWNTLLDALTWQENQRPKFGQIAMEGQLLSPGALSRLLAHRYRGEKIGDAAMRLGYLSPRMKDAVLNIQKHRQPAIGQYFLTNGLLGQEELGKWLISQRQHNTTVG